MPKRLLSIIAIVVVARAAHAQKQYQFTSRSVLEAHGDTIYWMRSATAKKADTILYVIRKDSTVRLLNPGPARELPEEVAKSFRFLFNEAREGDALMERLRAIPKPQ